MTTFSDTFTQCDTKSPKELWHSMRTPPPMLLGELTALNKERVGQCSKARKCGEPAREREPIWEP